MIIRDKNVVSEASGSEYHDLSTLSRSLRYDPTYAQVSLGSPLGHVPGVHKEGVSMSNNNINNIMQSKFDMTTQLADENAALKLGLSQATHLQEVNCSRIVIDTVK